MELDWADLSDIGRSGKRKNNQDYAGFFVPRDENQKLSSGSLFIVADGVGGAAHGEIASKYAVETVLHEYYKTPDVPVETRLKRAFLKANADIHSHATESGRYTKMATTLVAAVVKDNQLIVANVGDSRAYLIRKGEASQITRDHTLVAEMVRDGEMTEEEAAKSSRKSVLSRSIGGEATVVVDVFGPVNLEMGDRVLLCSDGLTRYANREMINTLSSGKDVEKATREMVGFAKKSGGVDNITVLLAETVVKSRTTRKMPTRVDEPALPEWQSAATEYPTVAEKKKRPSWAVFLGGLVVLSLAMIAILSQYQLLDRLDLIKNHATKTAIAVSVASTFEAEMATQTALSAAGPDYGVAGSLEGEQLGSPDEPTAQPSPQPSATTTAAPSATPEPTVKPEKTSTESALIAGGVWQCIYKVIPTDNLGLVLGKFGLGYDASKKYFYYDSCFEELEKKYQTCSESSYEIPNPSQISIGWYLIVYDSSVDGNEKAESWCTFNNNPGILYYPK